jgi:8-oxo-dGTP diphosphatase
MKTIEVVAAIIEHKSKILCVQRGPSKYDYVSKKWEFPGGKIEANESAQDAIKREISEELHLEIIDANFFTSVTHQYPDFKIKLDFFNCSVVNPDLVLTEHIESAWLVPAEMDALDWAAADIPAVEKLARS